MNHCEIRLLWNGATWEICSSGLPHGLEAGAEFLIRLPVAAAAEHPVPVSEPPTGALPTGEGRLLFPAATWLYLPLTPVKQEDKLWALWVAHRAAEKPELAKSPDKPLVPILLEEDLRFAHASSRGLAACSAMRRRKSRWDRMRLRYMLRRSSSAPRCRFRPS